MGDPFLSNYKNFSCQSRSAFLLLEVCKNHYKREKISGGGNDERGDGKFTLDRLG